MVMHARKLPRLDDGYFERHQSHPYQANAKYSSKPGYGDRFNSERTRDSPNGAMRTDSPSSYGDSPRERYPFKGSYSQRVREKEKDRANRSPKDRDRSFREQQDDERRGSYERGPFPEDAKEREKGSNKPLRMGDWSEHTSSSGKKYYYNCRTEMSQWEKPREWVEWEKEKDREREKERDREREREKNRDRDRHRNKEREKERDRKYERQNLNSSRMGNGPSERHSNFASASPNHRSGDTGPSHSNRDANQDQCLRESYRSAPHQLGHAESSLSRRHSDDRPSQDMDISPADSTPTSEASVPKAATPYTPDPRSTPTTATGSVYLAAALPRLISHPPSFVGTTLPTGPGHKQSLTSSGKGPLQSPQPLQGQAPFTLTTVQLNMLQQLISSSTSGTASTASISSLLNSILGGSVSLHSLGLGALQNLEGTDMSTHEVLQTLQAALMLSTGSSGPSNPGQPTMLPNLSGVDSGVAGFDAESSGSVPGGGGGGGGGGPPTPTHSERLDSQDIRKGSPASGLSSLSVAAASLRPSPSSTQALTPSLAAYFRQDLISHVMGWPADHLEKQAQKCSEELHAIGNLQVTKVSAELKMARSLVRVADIQATLQEQRILFLRQQMKEIDELKPPSHFISE